MDDLARIITDIREQARPLVGSRDDHDLADAGGGRGPGGVAGRGLPRHATSSTAQRARDHAPADRGAGLHARWRSRPTGPTPTASTASCAARRRRRRPSRRWAASSASRPGCGATPTCWTSSAGCARTTTAGGPRARVGFYGLDLYSLHALDRRRCSAIWSTSIPRRRGAPASATAASTTSARTRRPTATRPASACAPSCEDEVVSQLVELQRRARRVRRRDGRVAEDELFFAEQNARLVRNAEEYYRTMFRGRVVVLEPARPPHGRHARRAGGAPGRAARHGRAKVVVWAHNSHLGDAARHRDGRAGRAQRRPAGARAPRPTSAVLVGFTTYGGTVTAASDWDGPAERKRVRPRCPAATRPCSTGPACPTCCSICGATRRRSVVPPATPGARHRRHLSPRDRAPEPLLSRPPGRPVRRRPALRRHARRRAAGDRAFAPGRGARDIPDRPVKRVSGLPEAAVLASPHARCGRCERSRRADFPRAPGSWLRDRVPAFRCAGRERSPAQ